MQFFFRQKDKDLSLGRQKSQLSVGGSGVTYYNWLTGCKFSMLPKISLLHISSLILFLLTLRHQRDLRGELVSALMSRKNK